MKNLLCFILRGTFATFYILAMLKPKVALANTSAFMPQIEIAEQNFSVKAPAGWKVRQHFRGKTLFFEDPLATSQDGVDFNRNITIAIQAEVRPIDSLEAKRLSQKLVRELSKTLKDFQIIQARVIDYRTRKDAILIYSSFTLNSETMRQMHIYTAGSTNSVLLTYTDLERSFETENSLDKAWASMMSAELNGEAPKRYDGILYTGSGLAFIVSAAFLGRQLRRRQSNDKLRLEEDFMFDGDDDFEIIRNAGVEPWHPREARQASEIA